MINISYSQLILCSAHIGHSVHNTLLFSGWMLYIIRQKIWFINLMKTILMLKKAFIALKLVIERSGPVWFINCHKAANRIVRSGALNCGEFFVSTFWIRGMLSNYLSVNSRGQALSYINASVYTRRIKLSKLNFDNWIFTRFSWPRAVFISSAFFSPLAVKEAYCLGIPNISVIDTILKAKQ